jgi:HPt (histidine-containing phosphotransfer) domain-containing protein
MINWDRVDELRSDFGEDDFVEIVALFIDEVEGKLDEMVSDPHSDLAEGFHFLKGSAANLGFQGLFQATAAAEVTPDAERLAEIVEIFATSKASFFDGLGRGQSAA